MIAILSYFRWHSFPDCQNIPNILSRNISYTHPEATTCKCPSAEQYHLCLVHEWRVACTNTHACEWRRRDYSMNNTRRASSSWRFSTSCLRLTCSEARQDMLTTSMVTLHCSANDCCVCFPQYPSSKSITPLEGACSKHLVVANASWVTFDMYNSCQLTYCTKSKPFKQINMYKHLYAANTGSLNTLANCINRCINQWM